MLASLSQSNFVDKNVGLLHLINKKKLVSLVVNVFVLETRYSVRVPQ
jgi:hypothetical protein